MVHTSVGLSHWLPLVKRVLFIFAFMSRLYCLAVDSMAYTEAENTPEYSLRLSCFLWSVWTARTSFSLKAYSFAHFEAEKPEGFMEIDRLTVIGLDHRAVRVNWPGTLDTPDRCNDVCDVYSLMLSLCWRTWESAACPPAVDRHQWFLT